VQGKINIRSCAIVFIGFVAAAGLEIDLDAKPPLVGVKVGLCHHPRRHDGGFDPTRRDRFIVHEYRARATLSDTAPVIGEFETDVRLSGGRRFAATV
jgi:hypothetical protein